MRATEQLVPHRHSITFPVDRPAGAKRSSSPFRRWAPTGTRTISSTANMNNGTPGGWIVIDHRSGHGMDMPAQCNGEVKDLNSASRSRADRHPDEHPGRSAPDLGCWVASLVLSLGDTSHRWVIGRRHIHYLAPAFVKFARRPRPGRRV